MHQAGTYVREKKREKAVQFEFLGHRAGESKRGMLKSPALIIISRSIGFTRAYQAARIRKLEHTKHQPEIERILIKKQILIAVGCIRRAILSVLFSPD